MRKVTLIASGILFVIGFWACKESRPEPVVEKYFTHFYKSEFVEIQKYVMPEHRSYYELLSDNKDLLQDTSSSGDSTKRTPVKISKIECDITGDTVAICSCLIQYGENTKGQVIQLKKVKKEWLVNQGKEGGRSFMNDNNGEENRMPPAEVSETVPSDGEENTVNK
ncbi:MAG: hypothetical protein LBL13_07665 [Bacteroidales bacterium]|jgi:hypothetical protein|nr:hypothetical protein [Bacteroidales bacterium]